MKSIAILITFLVAGGAAQATEMVEVPNAQAYLPPPEPTLLEARRDTARGLIVGGVVVMVAGVGLGVGAGVYAAENPCILPLACIFGPPHTDELATFGALAFTGAITLAGGITMTALGGSRLSRMRRYPLRFHVSGSGLALSGRF